MRPPYSAYDDRILGILKGLGYSVVMWSYDAQDWQYASTEFPADYDPQKVLDIVGQSVGAADGSLIHIQHDNEFTQASVELVPLVLQEMRSAGFAFVTLKECLGGSIDVAK
jgi:peptidoglycan/xylan/chitin deacetylase (PgdA/CDA1 family)